MDSTLRFWPNRSCVLDPSFKQTYISRRSRYAALFIVEQVGLESEQENTFYLTRYIRSTVMFRPELRFDHSWDREGYNNGNARNQLFFGMDVIYKF